MDLSLADLWFSRFGREQTRRHAAACIDASRRYGLATESVAHLWLAGGHALAGDDAAMQAAIDAALAKDPDDPRILGDLYGRVLVTRAFVRDELHDLRPLHDTMMEHVRRAPPHTSVYPGRILWMLLHTMDDDDLGEPARAEFADVAARMGLPWFTHAVDMGEAVALGRRGEAAAATARFEVAHGSLLERSLNNGMVYTTTMVVAGVAIRDGWGDPVRWLREPEAFFTAEGYDRLARRCRTLLGEAGAPVPRRRGDTEVPLALRALGVTGREVDVLKLVIEGRSNKEIAAELVLSPKTVERHLSSLFSRLGVANRRELAEVGGARLA
jgi:DNA-binding CsgD family transcriptional regulator